MITYYVIGNKAKTSFVEYLNSDLHFTPHLEFADQYVDKEEEYMNVVLQMVNFREKEEYFVFRCSEGGEIELT